MSAVIRLATLLQQAARGELSPREVLEVVDAELAQAVDWNQPLFAKAYHLLQHFAADEDIRATDTKYAQRQKESIEEIVRLLREQA